ncbi:MAG: preprotein translocase subunit SecA, partial [Syntrophaceae bacterium]|nr:preprotein translocase subunit SecA [Syntrophaceae bacterium]
MIGYLLKKVVGSKNDREIKRLSAVMRCVTDLEPLIERLTDSELKAKTPYFKEKLAQGASLDDILVEAFAVVREVSKRTLKMRPFDVQVIGGIVLHEGTIAEMKTG